MNLIATCIALTAAGFMPVVSWTAALAAETSMSNVLGFTPNGTTFVYEEFGFRDGTGAPYASVFAVDVKTDKWLPGTPVRLSATEDDAHALEQSASGQNAELAFQTALSKMRASARKSAAPLVEGFGSLQPATRRVFNTTFDFTDAGKFARFAVKGYRERHRAPLDSKVWRLDLATKTFAANEKCYSRYEAAFGYKLTLTHEKTRRAIILNNDTRLPNSRGCPQSYSIEEVFTHDTAGDGFALAILLRYSLPGFEGPDGRLLAITAQVEAE